MCWIETCDSYLLYMCYLCETCVICDTCMCIYYLCDNYVIHVCHQYDINMILVWYLLDPYVVAVILMIRMWCDGYVICLVILILVPPVICIITNMTVSIFCYDTSIGIMNIQNRFLPWSFMYFLHNCEIYTKTTNMCYMKCTLPCLCTFPYHWQCTYTSRFACWREQKKL